MALLNGGYGQHVLFTIPSPQLPEWLGGLHLGGPVAAESLVAATLRGMAILCVLFSFGVFNGAVSPHRILRGTPAVLFQAGLVVTVGLTLLPSSIEDVRRIREMRALRGARTGVPELPALVVPAVVGGLERSMRLAEAMEARGYGTATPLPRVARVLAACSAPLLLGAISLWSFAPTYRWLAALSAVTGVAFLASWGIIAARKRRTTQLETDPPRKIDRFFIGLSFVIAAVAIAGPGWLHAGYDPFAGLHSPSIALPGALLIVACAWPALRLLLEIDDTRVGKPAATPGSASSVPSENLASVPPPSPRPEAIPGSEGRRR
jgi:energy-coupling factor transport system permease protein